MALRRVFVDRLEAGRAWATGDRAHHLHRVARLRPGEPVEVSDHERLFRAEVAATSNAEVVFELLDELNPSRPAVAVEAHAAIVKFPRFESALEKSVELGAAAFVPVAASRSEKGLVSAAAKRVERWRKIAEEAAQQSRRLAPPETCDPCGLPEALARPADLRLWLDFSGKPLWRVLDETPPPARVAVLVGPEGGWDEAEREAARRAGCRPVRLGDAVLRAETAVIAAMAAVAARWLTPEAIS